jgi:hypothetical protein
MAYGNPRNEPPRTLAEVLGKSELETDPWVRSNDDFCDSYATAKRER